MKYIETKKLNLLSTKEHNLITDFGEKIGTCQRYFNSSFQKIFSYIEKRDGYLNYMIKTDELYTINQNKREKLLSKTSWTIEKNHQKIGSLEYKFDLSKEKMYLELNEKKYVLESSIISQKVIMTSLDSSEQHEFYVHDLVYRRMMMSNFFEDWEAYYLVFLVFNNYN